ncbi:MAG TPA: BTAD domain-containing putative transcriptional regulator [Acidimicrobiia bacterium]|nr:BTAD domain-containing putative transcriptional regulator [Acidimicrobiia bacterium]
MEYPQAVEFRVLGPVEARLDGEIISLGGRKQRAVLALLIAGRGGVVSTDRLIECVWGDEPGPGARSTIQTYLSNLRSALGDVIVRDSAGYRLDVDPELMDNVRFVNAVSQAERIIETSPAEASQTLREALALWRGHAFDDVTGTPPIDQEARRLEEMRLHAVGARITAELAIGRHAEVVVELEILCAEHPLREDLRRLHMLALYRSGRQAEALRSFQKTRAFLADELGIDPSPELVQLEQRILEQDPDLLLDSEPQVHSLAFLVTDVEDSTALWEMHPRAMSVAIELQDRILTASVEAAGGWVVKRVGDSVDAAFADVSAAVRAATESQLALHATEWPETGPLSVRMAIDTGDVETRAGDHYGPVRNRCGRLLAAAHGGQVLLSADAHSTLAETSAGWEAKALGEYRFKGLGSPVHVFQLQIGSLRSDFPPLRLDRHPVTTATVTHSIRGYEVRQESTGGDFGIVYRAYQPSVGREVAIKVIRPEFANRPAFVRHFEEEARRVALLEHPHVVPLYDYWREPDGAYLVMRWVNGGSLAETLERGPWHPEPALRALTQVCHALSYAHRQGIVHGDLKPANVLLDSEGYAYLSDFGITARLIDRIDQGRPVTTSPAYITPEELDGRPPGPPSDIYALGLLTFEILSGQSPPPDGALPGLSALVGGVPPEVDAVITRATSGDPSARFATANEFLVALTAALGLGDDFARKETLTPTRNPYKGLRPFAETDAGDFHGRQDVIDALVDSVQGHRFVAIVGPSGVGKSSLVRAGLLPALRQGSLAGAESWVTADMFPGSYPFEELAAALLRVAIHHPGDLVEQLARDELGMRRVTKEMLPPETECLLVIDQFEELFTLTADDGTRRRFIDGLVALVTDPRSRVRVVLSLRADYLDRPLGHAELGELIRAGMIAVAAPGEDDLVAAVEAPARGVGVRFEPGVVSRIVTDVGSEPGGLPLLQYALTEMFDGRTSDVLDMAAYEAIGGVAGALARRAEGLYQGLDAEAQHAAPDVFLRLVSLGESAGDTRRRVFQRELRDLETDRSAVDQILAVFGSNRLLSFDRDPATRAPTVEVAHEALISRWDRFRSWIEERREDLILRARLSTAVREWSAQEESPAFLLQGGRLSHLETWAGASDLSLTSAERRFLRESRVAEEARRVQRRRRRQGILVGFAAAAAVMAILAVMAYSDRQIARSRELAAASISVVDDDPQLGVLLALEALDLVPDADLTAIAALHNAVRSSRILSAYTWPVEERGGILSGDISPDGSMVAITGGTGLLRVIDGGGAVVWEITDEAGGAFWNPHFRPDGAVLAVSYQPPDDGVGLEPGIHVYEAGTGRLVEVVSPPPGCGFVGLPSNEAFTAHQSHLVLLEDTSGCDGGHQELQVYDMESDEVIHRAEVASVDPTDFLVAVDLASSRALVTEPGEFGPDSRMVDLTSGATIWEKPARLGFGGAHGLFALSEPFFGSFSVDLADPATGEPVRRFLFDEGFAHGVEFSPDGQTVYLLLSDGTALVVDVSTGRRLTRIVGSPVPASSLTVDAAGSRMVTFGFDGTARWWDLTQRPLGERMAVDFFPAFIGSRSVRAGGGIATVGGFTGHCPEQQAFGAVIDVATGTFVRQFDDIAGQVHAITLDGRTVIHQTIDNPGPETTCSNAIVGSIQARDAVTGAVISQFEGHCQYASAGDCTEPDPYPEWVLAMSVSSDGTRVAAGGLSGVIAMWDLETGTREWMKPLADHTVPFGTRMETVEGVSIAPDRSHVAVTWGSGESLLILDAEDGTELTTVPTASQWAVAHTPDGSRLVLAGRTLSVLDVDSWDTIWTVDDLQEGSAVDLAVSPNGTKIATTSQDGFVRIWNVEDGRLLHLIDIGEDWGKAVAFTDDTGVLVGTDAGLVAVLTIDLDELVEIARSLLTRTLTDQECRTYLHLDACPAEPS